MTRFAEKSFTVAAGSSKVSQEDWDLIFKKRKYGRFEVTVATGEERLLQEHADEAEAKGLAEKANRALSDSYRQIVKEL